MNKESLVHICFLFIILCFLLFDRKFCVHNRCSISMWLFSNRLSRIFYDKFDYWYHDDHDIPGDRPVHDPFDSLDPFSDPLTEAKKHRRELKYFLAVVLFILSFVMSFGAYTIHLIYAQCFRKISNDFSKCLSRE